MPELVVAPGGRRPPDRVHAVEPGEVVDHPDLGAAVQPDLGDGWIVYAEWRNGTGHPISAFTTTWTVPPAPARSEGQTIFVFGGLTSETMILQPVLQWGESAAGGGPYWTVGSWYADGIESPVFHSPLVRVKPGTVLVGTIEVTRRTAHTFTYRCGFRGLKRPVLNVRGAPELTRAVETLETYDVKTCSGYPAAPKTVMHDIAISTGKVVPHVHWKPVALVRDCGQHVIVASNSATHGQIGLHYRKA